MAVVGDVEYINQMCAGLGVLLGKQMAFDLDSSEMREIIILEKVITGGKKM